jgi:hypothetical protein
MKFRTIEQFSEDEGDLLFDNARPVVLDTDFVPVGTRSFDMNPDLGNNARFLASVEGIVDSLFNRRKQSFSRIIEAKQVPVLREKLADRYVALFCRHGLRCGGAALWLFTCFVDVRHICLLLHFARLYWLLMRKAVSRMAPSIKTQGRDGEALRNSEQRLCAWSGNSRSRLRRPQRDRHRAAKSLQETFAESVAGDIVIDIMSFSTPRRCPCTADPANTQFQVFSSTNHTTDMRVCLVDSISNDKSAYVYRIAENSWMTSRLETETGHFTGNRPAERMNQPNW